MCTNVETEKLDLKIAIIEFCRSSPPLNSVTSDPEIRELNFQSVGGKKGRMRVALQGRRIII